MPQTLSLVTSDKLTDTVESLSNHDLFRLYKIAAELIEIEAAIKRGTDMARITNIKTSCPLPAISEISLKSKHQPDESKNQELDCYSPTSINHSLLSRHCTMYSECSRSSADSITSNNSGYSADESRNSGYYSAFS